MLNHWAKVILGLFCNSYWNKDKLSIEGKRLKNKETYKLTNRQEDGQAQNRYKVCDTLHTTFSYISITKEDIVYYQIFCEKLYWYVTDQLKKLVI